MQPLFGRALFSLRNLGTEESVLAVAEGLSCEDNALFRHEVAYVLGQIQSRDEIRFRLVQRFYVLVKKLMLIKDYVCD